MPSVSARLCAHALPHPSGAAVTAAGVPSAPSTPTSAGAAAAKAAGAKEVSTADEDTEILSVDGAWFYRAHWAREAAFWTACALTAFLLRLLLRWNDDWHVRIRYLPVGPDDPRAEHVLLRDRIKRHSLADVRVLDERAGVWVRAGSYRGRALIAADPDAPRRFDWRRERFYFDAAHRQWTRIVYDTRQPYAVLQRRAAETAWTAFRTSGTATATHEHARRELTYGANILDIEPRPLWLLMLDELLKPFFAFQIFSIIVWFSQLYLVYAYTILGMSIFAILQTASTTWFNQRALQRLAETETPVSRFVLRPPPSPIGSGLGALPPPPPVTAAVPAWSSELLPGDLVVVTAGLTVPCDLVLLTGSCVVNEAMLTGESAPVLKVAIPANADTDATIATTAVTGGTDAKGPTRFNVGHDRDNKYMLFSGTRIVQARLAAQAPFAVAAFTPADGPETAPTTLWQFGRDQAVEALRLRLAAERPDISPEQVGRVLAAYRAQWTGQHRMPVIAMVVQTAFATAKGQLVRAILYPKPARFDFERQSYNFIIVLMLASLAGCLATVAYGAQYDLAGIEVFKRCLNLITVTIPPALPLALSIGVSAALLRVQEREVFCTSPPRMTNAGRVNCLCFDKTGTLTEEGLTLHGVTSVTPVVAAASHAAKRSPALLAMGALEQRIFPMYRDASSRPAALALYDPPPTTTTNASSPTTTTTSPGAHSSAHAAIVTDPESLDPADLAASLRLALVHVLAGCHSLSLLEADAAETGGLLGTASVPSPLSPGSPTRTTVASSSAAADAAAAASAAHQESTPTLDAADSSGDAFPSRELLLGKKSDAATGAPSYGTAPGARQQAPAFSAGGSASADPLALGIAPAVEDEDGVPPAELLGASRARFVGDPLEVQMFLSTGWSFAVRPDTDDDDGSGLVTASSSSALGLDTAPSIAFSPSSTDALTSGGYGGGTATAHGAGDVLPPCDDPLTVSAIWSYPALPRHVDTVLLPSRVLLAGPRAARTALAVLRRFDFDPTLRRMSVLVQHVPLDDVHSGAGARTHPVRATVLCKGAPESIKDACRPSTVPDDYDATLHRLAVAGFRVLACAVRPLRAASAGGAGTDAWLKRPRHELEHDLYFAGFLVMENRLKPTTAMYLDSYVRAGLRCIMVTGDNPLTATAVAKRCGPYFLRPSRRACLLELAPPADTAADTAASGPPPGSATTLPAMVLRDIDDAVDPIDFGVFLRERLPGVAVTPARLPPGPESPGAGTGAGAPALAEIDLVVTGPAYFTLTVHHDAVMAARKAMAAALARADPHHGGRRAGSWFTWRPWTTKTKATQASFSRLEDGQASTAATDITPLQLVLHRANIFARMSPQNKQELMGSLQDLSYVVCMTGDGANDSGALKAADVGISIQASPTPRAPAARRTVSERWRALLNEIGWSGTSKDKKARTQADAQAAMSAAPSIAAPFSTQLADIGVVRVVLTEGRACLVTTFSMFQYMFCYGVIQFTSVLVLYRNLLELADYQYLWADLGMVFPLVLTIPLMRAEPRLSRGRPEADLLAPAVWRSIIGLMVIIVTFQVGAQELLFAQPWYQQPDSQVPGFDTTYTIDSSTSFLFANFQYVIVAIALAQSYGVFRERIVQNALVALTFVAQLVVISLFVLLDAQGFDDAFSIIYENAAFSWKLWGLAMANGLVFILFERFFVPHMSPDEDPFDVDAVVKELPPPSAVVAALHQQLGRDDGHDAVDGRRGLAAAIERCKPRTQSADTHAAMVSAAIPDPQLTLLPRMRWRTPHYVVVEKVASPVWAAMST